MFAGIIQFVGRIRARRPGAAGVAFEVEGIGSEQKVAVGDSVNVNGVCQTVERSDPRRIAFTAVGETLKRTTLGRLRVGERVNLEKSATPDTALGGHIVQGHVDGIGTVRSLVRAGQDWILSVRVPQEVMEFVVSKGSIAIDGVSLTVIECKRDGIVTVTIVPYTREHTIVGSYGSGTKVNVEADVLARYARGAERIMKKGRT